METAELPTTSPTKAPAPFDNYGAADVILRSSDQYDFHVHKLVLSLASPFFKQMFSLTQPTSPPSPPVPPENDAEALSVIDVDEGHDTIDYLLRLCYPIVDPTPPTDVATVAKILEAAMKYELDEATILLKGTFLHFIPAEPLRVYAHACRLRLENEAGEVAKHWRDRNKSNLGTVKCITYEHEKNSPCSETNCPLRDFEQTELGSTWVKDMGDISAGCLYRLLCFMRSGVTTSFCDPPPTLATPYSSATHNAPLPNVDPGILERCPPDIILRSSDSKLIRTYRNFLAFAGATALIDQACVDTSIERLGQPVVDVEADEATIQNLLRTCEPCPFDVMTQKTFTSGELHQLWDVAQKYGMTRVEQAIKLSWTYHIQDAPLGVYLTAKRHGWDAEARKAALRSTSLPLFDKGGYASEMEFISAIILYDLYKCHHSHQKATFVLNPPSPSPSPIPSRTRFATPSSRGWRRR